MLTGLWTIGIKVPDLEKELALHRQLGNEIVLDETLEFDGEKYRIPLVKMGDKYLHLAEKMVYERLLDKPLPYGIAHLVYISSSFDQDVQTALASGMTLLMPVAKVSARFGERRVAFMRAPSGYMVEFIEIIRNLVPEV
jgi:hypothetical protein